VKFSRKFSSATQNDLWTALTNQAYNDNALQPSMSVAQIMNTWTLQTGFPVLKVTRKYADGSATVSQVNQTFNLIIIIILFILVLLS